MFKRAAESGEEVVNLRQEPEAEAEQGAEVSTEQEGTCRGDQGGGWANPRYG